MTHDCYCAYDSPETYHARIVARARKPRTCPECGEAIAVGDRYEYVWGIWEGRADTQITCADCLSLRQWAVISVPCFCWAHGNLLDDIRTMVDEVRADVPGFFFEYGRRVVRIRRARAERRASA